MLQKSFKQSAKKLSPQEKDHLTELPVDILFHILYFAGPESTLILGMTCKTLKEFTERKDVWKILNRVFKLGLSGKNLKKQFLTILNNNCYLVIQYPETTSPRVLLAKYGKRIFGPEFIDKRKLFGSKISAITSTYRLRKEPNFFDQLNIFKKCLLTGITIVISSLPTLITSVRLSSFFPTVIALFVAPVSATILVLNPFRYRLKTNHTFELKGTFNEIDKLLKQGRTEVLYQRIKNVPPNSDPRFFSSHTQTDRKCYLCIQAQNVNSLQDLISIYNIRIFGLEFARKRKVFASKWQAKLYANADVKKIDSRYYQHIKAGVIMGSLFVIVPLIIKFMHLNRVPCTFLHATAVTLLTIILSMATSAIYPGHREKSHILELRGSKQEIDDLLELAKIGNPAQKQRAIKALCQSIIMPNRQVANNESEAQAQPANLQPGFVPT